MGYDVPEILLKQFAQSVSWSLTGNNLDILFIHPGKLGGDFDQTITFLDFQTRPDLLHSDRTAETCAAETVEKTVDFTLQE